MDPTLEYSLNAMEDAQKSDKEDALDVLLDGVFQYEHLSVV